MANDSKPDLILVTETWANDAISNAYLSINGYELQPDLRVDRADTAQGRGGGLLVYTKIGVTAVKLDSNSDFSQHCTFKIMDITIYLIYRSPNAGPESIEKLATLIKSVGKNTLLIGDFNLPDINWTTGEAGGRSSPVLEAVTEAFMEQLVTFPTQVRGNVLDLVLTNVPERIQSVMAGGRLGASDHEIILVHIQCKGEQELIKETKNWRRANWDRMRRELKNVNWRREFRNKSTTQKWCILKAKIHEAVRKHVPKRKVYKNGRPPWLNKEILNAIRNKQRLWRERRSGGTEADYKEAVKKVRNLIRRAKYKHEKLIAENRDRNKRPFYAYIRGRTKCRPEVGPLKTATGETVTSSDQMASILNKYFSTVFTTETDAVTPTAGDRAGNSRVSTVRITEHEIKKKIMKLRASAAAGPDEIGPRVLQELVNEVSAPLTEIYRSSLATGDVPEDWRQANVTPIYKKGAKSDPGNYRPVSLTSVCCKVLESCIKDSIMHHLESNGLLNPSQHGFRAGHSCTTNLLEFLEAVTKAVDNGEPVDVVFLDFAKAFDKVPKKRLTEKMRAHGIRGDLLRWIFNWLSDRRQRVVLNGHASEWKEVLSGVPQGSVLGPLLFLIFINDLDEAAPTAGILRKFADDTKLGNNVAKEAGRNALQAALDGLYDWSSRWGMEFNVEVQSNAHRTEQQPAEVQHEQSGAGCYN